MAKLEMSNIPDRHEDVAYARALVGFDGNPTGRLRVIAETGRIEAEWHGNLGSVWLPLPLVSIKDKGRIIGAQEAPLNFNGS